MNILYWSLMHNFPCFITNTNATFHYMLTSTLLPLEHSLCHCRLHNVLLLFVILCQHADKTNSLSLTYFSDLSTTFQHSVLGSIFLWWSQSIYCYPLPLFVSLFYSQFPSIIVLDAFLSHVIFGWCLPPLLKNFGFPNHLSNSCFWHSNHIATPSQLPWFKYLL